MTTEHPSPTQEKADNFKVMAHGDDPLTGPPVNVDVPVITGTPAVGEVLECTLGNWQGEPTDYAANWLSDGVNPIGNGQRYTIQTADSGHGLTAVVTATNAQGSTTAPPTNAITIP